MRFLLQYLVDIENACKEKITHVRESTLVCKLPGLPIPSQRPSLVPSTQPSQPSTAPRQLPPPPPPPLPMPNVQPIQGNLPAYLKPKNKYQANVPMKKVNWTEIKPGKISKNAFWVKCQEQKLVSEDILDGLASNFKQMSTQKVDKKSEVRTLIMKKHVDLRIMTPKSAMAISILLAASLKRVSYEKVKESILNCDTSILNSDIIEQLIKFLPPPDQLKLLHKIKNKGDELSEAEKFTATIGEIDQLVPRLQGIGLKLRFDDIVEDIKSDIVTGTAACEEIECSKKFAKILELILSFGNYLNSGSMKNPAYGFDISFLTSLKDTKDSDNKQTLLHYTVQTIEKKFPELMSFDEELPHVNGAAKVRFEKIQENLQQITTPLGELNSVLKNLEKGAQSSDDKFCEIMDDIALQYNDQLKALIAAKNRMENHFKEVADYFAFDPKVHPMEDFFVIIKTFTEMFKQAHKENIKFREQEKKRS